MTRDEQMGLPGLLDVGDSLFETEAETRRMRDARRKLAREHLEAHAELASHILLDALVRLREMTAESPTRHYQGLGSARCDHWPQCNHACGQMAAKHVEALEALVAQAEAELRDPVRALQRRKLTERDEGEALDRFIAASEQPRVAPRGARPLMSTPPARRRRRGAA